MENQTKLAGIIAGIMAVMAALCASGVFNNA